LVDVTATQFGHHHCPIETHPICRKPPANYWRSGHRFTTMAGLHHHLIDENCFDQKVLESAEASAPAPRRRPGSEAESFSSVTEQRVKRRPI